MFKVPLQINVFLFFSFLFFLQFFLSFSELFSQKCEKSMFVFGFLIARFERIYIYI
jgi:hypothetical protein